MSLNAAVPMIARSAPGAQRVTDGVDRAQAAAVLDRDAGLGDDPAQVVERLRRAGAGAVEVDDVQEARARVDPGLGGLERVVVVGRRVLELRPRPGARPGRP